MPVGPEEVKILFWENRDTKIHKGRKAAKGREKERDAGTQSAGLINVPKIKVSDRKLIFTHSQNSAKQEGHNSFHSIVLPFREWGEFIE